jgi:DNA-binding NtrC family response regulator
MAQHFLSEFGRKYGKAFTGIGREAEQALRAHQWKGNIRELRNMIERAVLLGGGPELTPPELGLNSGPAAGEGGGATDAGNLFSALSPQGLDLPALHESLDRHYFRKALELNDGNATMAAHQLNMSYYAFRRRREKLKI